MAGRMKDARVGASEKRKEWDTATRRRRRVPNCPMVCFAGHGRLRLLSSHGRARRLISGLPSRLGHVARSLSVYVCVCMRAPG